MAEDRAPVNDRTLNQGLPDHRGLDDVGRQRLLDSLAPSQPNIVGNFADLQRLGGAVADPSVANTKAVEQAVALPPDVSEDDVKAAADAQAAHEKAAAKFDGGK